MKNPSKPVFLAILMAAASPLSAQTLYWDTNGATPGAGNPANGTWDAGTTANWSTSAAGDVATTTFTNGDSIVFSAGNDAATAAVTVVGAPTTNSITFQEGTTTLSGANFDNFGTGSIQYTVLNGAHGIINQSTGAYNADFDVQGNGTLFINDVRGGGTTAKTGTGTLTVNRLDSVLTVNGGTVIYNGGGVNAKLKNTTINNGGTLVLNGASFDGVSRNLVVNAGGRFEMATGLSQEVNSLSGAGPVNWAPPPP